MAICSMFNHKCQHFLTSFVYSLDSGNKFSKDDWLHDRGTFNIFGNYINFLYNGMVIFFIKEVHRILHESFKVAYTIISEVAVTAHIQVPYTVFHRVYLSVYKSIQSLFLRFPFMHSAYRLYLFVST